MRVMVIVKASKDSEAGVMPSEKLLMEMGAYNEELVKAGVMLAGEGLKASSHGKRVRFSGDKRTVIDGPFAESKELIAGFLIIQAASLAEAVEWARRCPVDVAVAGTDREAGARARFFAGGQSDYFIEFAKPQDARPAPSGAAVAPIRLVGQP